MKPDKKNKSLKKDEFKNFMVDCRNLETRIFEMMEPDYSPGMWIAVLTTTLANICACVPDPNYCLKKILENFPDLLKEL